MEKTEALKILKDMHDTALFSVRTALEILIPELRESEDERNWKAVLDCVKDEALRGWLEKQKDIESKYEGMVVVSQEEWDTAIADAFKHGMDEGEKQKEQPKEELVYRLNGLMQEYIKEGKNEEEKEHRFKCYQLFWDALEDAEFFEQKEQKPAEKQDYTDLNDMERAIHRGFLSAGVENVPVTIIKETAKECLAQMKPAEWSEEDEETLEKLYRLLVICRGEKKFIQEADYNKMDNLLKSLRPSWKPSKEQMDILDKVYHYLWADKNATADMQDGLGDFIDELKEL